MADASSRLSMSTSAPQYQRFSFRKVFLYSAVSFSFNSLKETLFSSNICSATFFVCALSFQTMAIIVPGRLSQASLTAGFFSSSSNIGLERLPHPISGAALQTNGVL